MQSAKLRCLVDHIKPAIWDKSDHIIFYVGTNDISSYKDAGQIANCSCNVSVSNINTRKDKNQHKVQEVDDQLKEICTNKNINLIKHRKNIKHQNVNISQLHLTNKDINMLLNTFMGEYFSEYFKDISMTMHFTEHW